MTTPADHPHLEPDVTHSQAPDPRERAAVPPQAGPVPPPGCPMHGMDPQTLTRLYGAEAEADPMGIYERLRKKHGPIAPVLLNGDLPAWMVLGYRENLEAMRNPSRFSRNSRLWRDRIEGRVAMDNPLNPITTWQPITVFTDGTDHERLRVAITESIARFDRRGLRRWINLYANQLVDRFCATGRADAVSQFAEHLPMMVTLQLLGVPEAYSNETVQAARDLIRGTETAIRSNEYIMSICYDLVARRHGQPAKDFTTWLIEHPSKLTDDEVAQHLRLMLIAAFEASANLIANTLRMVMTDPRFRANLAGGHMTLPDAVEQLLWDEPPFMTLLGRWAACDTTLGGQQIRKGDVLLLGLAAANMDTTVRPDPTAPVRGNRSHLAFSGGEHECPGQDVARAIADAGVEAILSRLPDLRLSVDESELSYRSALMSRQLESLPVEFTPKPPQPAVDLGPVGPAPGTPIGGEPAAALPPQPERAPRPVRGPRRWWASFTDWLAGRQ